MLCDACHQREALVRLTSTINVEGVDQAPGAQQGQHFCRECADRFFARTPGMNASRDLICLSDWYRSKLYDLLEQEHPEAFDYSTTVACKQGSELARAFLRRELAKAGVELNEDGFMMLWSDFNAHITFTLAPMNTSEGRANLAASVDAPARVCSCSLRPVRCATEQQRSMSV